jgi:predicted ATPase
MSSTTTTIFTTAIGGIIFGFALSSIWDKTFQKTSSPTITSTTTTTTTSTTAPSKATSDTGSSNTKIKLMHTAINKVKLLQAASKAHTQELASTSKKGTLDLDHQRVKKLMASDTEVAPEATKRVFTVCLTGGPCSGKSSSLAMFVKELTSRGFDVYTVPEVPTLVMNSGFPYPGMDESVTDLLFDFELQLFKTQLAFEETVLHMARMRDTLLRKRPCVIFYDRGLLDMKAYMPPTMWKEIIQREEMEMGEGDEAENTLRARYDLVVHLVTAADGAERFYTTENNATRTETPEMARENDRRVATAWEGHKNWFRVDNSGITFMDKVTRATNHVLTLVGASPVVVNTKASS